MFSANFKPKNNSCGNARFPCDSTAFLLSYILTLKFTKATEKSVILEKSDFLTQNFKISPRKDSPAHGFTHFCQVSRKSVKWKWPNGCAVGLFITKKVGILPLSLWLLKPSRQKFYRITLSSFSSLCRVVQICPVFEEIYPKMSPVQTRNNIGVKSVGFSATINCWLIFASASIRLRLYTIRINYGRPPVIIRPFCFTARPIV